MTTAIANKAKAAQRIIAEKWLASAAWAVLLGAASGLACVAVRLFFRMLQWVFVQQTGMLPTAAAALSPARRILIPVIGAALATVVVRMTRRSTQDLPFEEYVEAVRFNDGHIPFLSTAWRTVSSAFSVATGAAIGREGSMIQFAAAVTSWVGERAPVRPLSLKTGRLWHRSRSRGGLSGATCRGLLRHGDRSWRMGLARRRTAAAGFRIWMDLQPLDPGRRPSLSCNRKAICNP